MLLIVPELEQLNTLARNLCIWSQLTTKQVINYQSRKRAIKGVVVPAQHRTVCLSGLQFCGQSNPYCASRVVQLYGIFHVFIKQTGHFWYYLSVICGITDPSDIGLFN